MKRTVFGVRMLYNPFDRFIVGEDSRPSSNRVKSKFPDCLVGQLVVLDIRKIVILKNCINPRPFNLVGINDSATGI